MFDEIANELKTAREKNSMTLAQLANKTKIDIRFLEAMEHGDFSFLPDLYVRAFLKNYARMVGLNENKMTKKYDAAKQGLPYVEEETTSKEKDVKLKTQDSYKEETTIVPKYKPDSAKKDALFTFDAVSGANPVQDAATFSSRRNLILGLSAFGVLILFFFVYFLFIDSGSQQIVVEKPFEEVVQQSQRYIENDQSDGIKEVNPQITDSLYLIISTTDTSWVKMFVDDSSSDEFILLPKSQKTVKAKSNYRITFGNSGAIKLQLNNKPLMFSGKNRVPLTVKIDKTGLKNLESPQR